MPWIVVNGDLASLIATDQIGKEPEVVQAMWAALSPNMLARGCAMGYRVIEGRIYEFIGLNASERPCCLCCGRDLEMMITDRGLAPLVRETEGIVCVPNFCFECMKATKIPMALTDWTGKGGASA
jgi:hypothetical protein